MPKIKRRLRDDERKLIRSGQVFVFDERESGIKRWTDGLLWSPSRILMNFLVSWPESEEITTALELPFANARLPSTRCRLALCRAMSFLLAVPASV